MPLAMCFSTVFSLIPRRTATSFCDRSSTRRSQTTSRQRSGRRSKASASRSNPCLPPHQRSGDTSSTKTCEGSKSPIGSIETTRLRRRRSVIRCRALANRNDFGWVGSDLAAAS